VERFGLLVSEDRLVDEWLEARPSGVPYRAPDGSSIRLDAGSRGRFTSNEDRAQFDLHGGRAAFDVSKRPGQDWTVVAGRYTVHVIGTRFAVSYQQQDLDVWVEEGRVEVRMPQRSDPVVLESGDHLRAAGDQLTLAAPRASAADESGNGAAESPTAAPPPVDDSANPTPLVTTQPPASDGAADWHALYVMRQYSEALRAARGMGFDRLTETLGATRLLDLADAARLGGDMQAALRALSALEARFPDVAFARDSDFLVARLHAQRGETSSAARRLTSYLERGEGARYSLEALGRLMELESRGGDKTKARALAQRYVERAPNGPYRRLAESLLQQR
jgi:TolA-binding protein